MAQGKISFLLYCNILSTFEELSDEEAGLLIKHILRYVNDLNPDAPDRITKLMFEPIKQQLKLDLKKYEGICERNQNNGLKGGRPKNSNPTKPKKPTGLNDNPTKPKKPDIEVEVDIEKELDIDNNKKEEREVKIIAAKAATLARKDIFYKSLIPYSKTVSKDILRAFFDYWSEMNSSGTKMRMEQQPTWEVAKRLVTWSNKEKINGTNQGNRNYSGKQDAADRRASVDNLMQLSLAILQQPTPEKPE